MLEPLWRSEFRRSGTKKSIISRLSFHITIPISEFIKHTGLKEATVWKNMKALQKEGLITIIEQPSGSSARLTINAGNDFVDEDKCLNILEMIAEALRKSSITCTFYKKYGFVQTRDLMVKARIRVKSRAKTGPYISFHTLNGVSYFGRKTYWSKMILRADSFEDPKFDIQNAITKVIKAIKLIKKAQSILE